MQDMSTFREKQRMREADSWEMYFEKESFFANVSPAKEAGSAMLYNQTQQVWVFYDVHNCPNDNKSFDNLFEFCECPLFLP